MSKIKSQQGFTLIEALIVTTILAAVLALSYQMVAVFWRAANHSSSGFAEAQQDFYFQLALKGSVNGMLDYYTYDGNQLNAELYFKQTPATLRFVSSYSVLGFENTDVAVRWRIKSNRASKWPTIVATECPLNRVLITEPDSFPEHESCREQPILTIDEGWRFDSDPFVPASTLNEPQQQAQQHYRLPVTVRLIEQSGQSFEFKPKVVNTSKWYLMRRQVLNDG